MKRDKELIYFVVKRYHKQIDAILEDFAKHLQSDYNTTLQIGTWRHFETDEAHKIEKIIELFKQKQDLL